jgi:hypothetical protein
VSLESEAAATSSPNNDARYPSFAELRAAHLQLKDSAVGAGDAAALATRIRQFLTEAQSTGAILVDPSIRRAAQSVLDYWSAELAGLPGANTQDFVPFMLAPAEISTLSAVEQPTVEGTQLKQSKEEQRSLIRFSGMARQWRNADKQPDFMLTGEALQQARPLADQDPDLKELVDASEAALRARLRKRRRMILYICVSVACMVGTAVGLLAWQKYVLPQQTKLWIREIKATNDGEAQARNLRWLAFFQLWLPPYDLSGIQNLKNITLPGSTLYAPNFSSAVLTGVDLTRANLIAASFTGSSIGVEGASKDRHWNEFSKAELKLSQFREARILTSSFAGADLYRAVFDRALLCDVNFSRADLQSASFWGANLDPLTYGWLRHTAWWVAVGWNSSDLQELLKPAPPQASDPQGQIANSQTSAHHAEVVRQSFLNSDRFRTEVEIPITETAAGTFGRATALNDMAWTLAIWGIDPESVPQKTRSLPTETQPCNDVIRPKDAFDAANQAICIVANLKAESLNKEARSSWLGKVRDALKSLKDAILRNGAITDNNYDYWLANMRDTQAYILMQANRMQEARDLFEKDLAQTQDNSAMLFRYAVTLFAAGQQGDALQKDALQKFDTAINQMHYLPSHELQNLKRYIPLDVLQMTYKALDLAYPAPQPAQSCPAPAKSG